jgi:hypothetical protein
LFLWLFSIPFRAKGKVLRDATAEVHSVRPAAAPVAKACAARIGQDGEDDDGADTDLEDDDESDDAPDGPRDYYEVEVTITPQTPTGPFMHWEIGELTLVKPAKRWSDTDDTCKVDRVDVVRDGTVVLEKGQEDEEEDAGSKVFGPRRLKMLVGVEPGVRELAFSYYFEKFGKLELPAGR